MPFGRYSIWVGFDDREVIPYAVARDSIRRWTEHPTPTCGVVMQDLVNEGLYNRPIEKRVSEKGAEILWDVISDAPMSTQFAISRFFILHLACRVSAKPEGWAMFVDCDVLARGFLDDLFTFAEDNSDKALLCVPHNHKVVDNEYKKDGQLHINYTRKNWSSVMLLNRAHPANKELTLNLLNTVPGRDLHRFCWLDDSDIGHLDVKWNHLAGVEGSQSSEPRIVHFTNGGPWVADYADVEYASEWHAAFKQWVR